MLWPELDQLLRDEDDGTTVSTPYTAAVLEYRVEFHDPTDTSLEKKNWANANGHAVYDAQHPCRYCILDTRDVTSPIYSNNLRPHIFVVLIREGLMWLLEGSFILLNLIVLAPIWSLKFRALGSRKFLCQIDLR